jgi:Outer membrane protein beta-barrel family/Carboxypeptidase regulatory-like domain
LRAAVLYVFLFFLLSINAIAQSSRPLGLLSGQVISEQGKPVEAASVRLFLLLDSSISFAATTDQAGDFKIQTIPFGHYRLCISHVGLRSFCFDSIWFRADKLDFNITDIVLKFNNSEQLKDVVVYAEKPLFESKDGAITFNVSESAAAAGSSASELLTQVPLVTRDPDGKISLRGKEPRILIDDKPVELNLQQLQDLLESMPGSSIEKIEVMTQPPPQYAHEQGGVINIVTKKGRVGKSGRLSVAAGTRGEQHFNGNFTYRKNGWALTLTAGFSNNLFTGESSSMRKNLYADSSNYLSIVNENRQRTQRPLSRISIDYEPGKKTLFNLVAQYNGQQGHTLSDTRFINLNRFNAIHRFSDRSVTGRTLSGNPALTLSFQYKPKPGEILKVQLNYNHSISDNDREFYQRFFFATGQFTGIDSLQRQLIDQTISTYTVRFFYDKMLLNKKTFLSLGSYYQRGAHHVINEATYKKRPEQLILPLPGLSNDLWFYQAVGNWRLSVRQVLQKEISITAGAALEQTRLFFDLLTENRKVNNQYLSWLPFANVNKAWKDKLSMTLSYRRTLQRPGLGQLNPTVDFSDPYNVRFGNPFLEPSGAHNFDLVISRTRRGYFLNLGFGYNSIEDIFSPVRTLLDGGKTQVTWENISGRKEVEFSTWNGVNLSARFKVNVNASITLQRYSDYDIMVRKFRNGASFSSSVGYSWIASDVWNANGTFNVNRFANPQGFANWTAAIQMAVQRKLVKKRLLVTATLVDPFIDQRRRNFTHGPNFSLEGFTLTRTQNYRLTLAYVISAKKPTLSR